MPDCSVTRSFGDDPVSVAEARRFVGDRLDAWGLAARAPAALLAVSELVTNALTHGRGTVEVALTLAGGALEVAVGDEGHGDPSVRRSDPSGPTPGGWGLQFVDRLADTWGSRRSRSGGTVVWFTLGAAAPVAPLTPSGG